MKQPFAFPAIAAGVTLGALVVPAEAVLIDFNRENTAAWTDAGGTLNPPIADVAQPIYVGSATATVGSATVTGDVGFTLSTSASGSVFNRDRNSGTHGPKNNFFRDFLGASEGNSYTLTLSNLAAGTYNFASWHYDPGSTQFGEPSSASRDVLLTDATGAGINLGTVTTPVPSTLDKGADPFLQVSPFTFQLTSDGVNPVTITYGGTHDGVFVINGFEIVVPEPATAALVAIGGAVMLTRRRDRAAR